MGKIDQKYHIINDIIYSIMIYIVHCFCNSLSVGENRITKPFIIKTPSDDAMRKYLYSKGIHLSEIDNILFKTKTHTFFIVKDETNIKMQWFFCNALYESNFKNKYIINIGEDGNEIEKEKQE